MNRVTRTVPVALATLALALIVPALAHAQNSRSWVSGVGDDVNPCSRTAPCKTFAGAISKTLPMGEISVLDPGGYGAVTITKAITINGTATLASIVTSGTNGIVIAAGPNDVVILRNISIFGMNSGINAIHYVSGAALVIENCSFSGFTNNTVNVQLTASGSLLMKNTGIRGGMQGVAINTSAGTLDVVMDNVDIRGAASQGVHAVAGAINIINSVITQNGGVGVLSNVSSTISIERSMISGNATGLQVQPGATIRMSDNGIYDNATSLVCNGGQMLSRGDNRIAGGGGCAPTGSVPVQ